MWDAHRPFYNDIIIDITDVIEKKLGCLEALMSQGYNGAYTRKRLETSALKPDSNTSRNAF